MAPIMAIMVECMKQHKISFLMVSASLLLLPASPALAQQDINRGVYGETDAEGSASYYRFFQPYVDTSATVVQDANNADRSTSYTSLGAGVRASLYAREATGQAFLRYERRTDLLGKNEERDYITGQGNGIFYIAGDSAKVFVGGIARRAQADYVNGLYNSFYGPTSSNNAIYSIYAGPDFHKRLGESR